MIVTNDFFSRLFQCFVLQRGGVYTIGGLDSSAALNVNRYNAEQLRDPIRAAPPNESSFYFSRFWNTSWIIRYAMNETQFKDARRKCSKIVFIVFDASRNAFRTFSCYIMSVMAFFSSQQFFPRTIQSHQNVVS